MSIFGPPSAEMVRYNQEVMSYLGTNIYRSMRARGDRNNDAEAEAGSTKLDQLIREAVAAAAKPPVPGQAVAGAAVAGGRGSSFERFKKVILDFVSIFNGPFHEKQLIHYCWGPGCCVDLSVTHERMRLLMEHILPVKMLGGLRPPRTPHYGPPAPIGWFTPRIMGQISQ